MQAARGIALVGATMAMGLIAGVFALYAHTISPALATLDDRSFIATFQALDRAIVNPWFMVSAFVGALAGTALAAVTHLGRPALPWIVVALILYLVAVVVTVAVHLPLNDALEAAGDPASIVDPGAVRRQFDEGRWAAWNLVRTSTGVAAFGCLCWALVRHGQAG